MSVIRIKKSENFVSIHKGALENPKLSFKAKGLWAYCMTRTNDWVFHVSHLSTVSKEKEDAVYSAIKELEAEGYVRKVQENINGKFQKVDYEVYEEPQIQKILPQPGFPDAGFPDAGNPALVNIDNVINIEKENSGAGAPNPSPPPFKPPKRKKILEEFKEVAPRVHLTASQEDALQKRSKAEIFNLQDVYSKLSNWKLAKQISGGSGDFKAITEWVVKAVKEDSVGPGSSKSVDESASLELSKKIVNKFPKLEQSNVVRVGHKSIEFVLGQTYEEIKFNEFSFRDKCLNRLRKMNLNIDGL